MTPGCEITWQALGPWEGEIREGKSGRGNKSTWALGCKQVHRSACSKWVSAWASCTILLPQWSSYFSIHYSLSQFYFLMFNHTLCCMACCHSLRCGPWLLQAPPVHTNQISSCVCTCDLCDWKSAEKKSIKPLTRCFYLLGIWGHSKYKHNILSLKLFLDHEARQKFKTVNNCQPCHWNYWAWLLHSTCHHFNQLHRRLEKPVWGARLILRVDLKNQGICEE